MDASMKKCHHSVDPVCGTLCSHDNLTHLMMRIEVIEGRVVEELEKEGIVALHDLMESLEYGPCAITMAVGSLVRQGVIRCKEYGPDVFLEFLSEK